jgi:signal transduction histidine kinase
MRSLFAKILGWFGLTLVITTIASLVTSALSYRPYSSRRQTPFSMLLTLEVREAREAFESGGPNSLRASLDRFSSVTGASSLVFTDAAGQDLVTGESRAGLIDKARTRTFPFSAGNGTTFARFSPDGQYCLLLTISLARLLFSSLQPSYLIVLGIAVLLCYLLAYRLTLPLRRLRRAVDQFGRDDMSARAEQTRHDELGELAGAFNRMADRIQTLLAAERRLLLDISHELRSPLARLSVAVELARSGEESALPLDRIQREADRLNSLISQMLEVTRREGDPAHRKLEHVRLDELVRTLIDDCVIEARIRGCSLSLDSPSAVSIDGDTELLRRAIENVVRNAIRYAPRETQVEVGVDEGVGDHGARVRVRVRDYGPGVPVEALNQLFDPFFRVESDRNRGSGGVGLGLSIARRAVELHKGTLRASNAFPGLLVEIELPV